MKNYFDFLNKKLSVDFKSGLTVDERQLLEFLAMNASNGMPLCVAGAMSLSSIASPATLHRRIDDLIAKGYISHKFEDDKRTKFLIPTSKANAYFKKVAELFEGQP
jgi:DNA-binding MarR family transcriptional regulator